MITNKCLLKPSCDTRSGKIREIGGVALLTKAMRFRRTEEPLQSLRGVEDGCEENSNTIPERYDT